MVITNEDYKRYEHFAKVVTGENDESQDLLQDCLMKFIRLKVPQEKLTDNYVFVSLIFMWRDINKKNKFVDDFDDQVIEGHDVINFEELIDTDKIFQKKLNTIMLTVERFNDFDKKLYQLHFIWGQSCRAISRKVGVSHVMISKKINRIKEVIKNNNEL